VNIRRLLRAPLVALSLTVIAALATPASADTLTLYTPWSSMLPGWNDQFVPSSDNDCAAGRNNCLNSSLKELNRILTINGQACSHNAIFPLAYLRMTQTYGWTRTQPGYYEDVPYMNHMDAVFAKYYTDAYYNWANGNRAAVPQAWLYALDASKNKTVTGAGDLFLGMNAHINRDLPFVLYRSGLVDSYGDSGKGDYDIVEKWLNDDTAPLLAEAAQRFDPTIDDSSNPLVNYLSFQMVSDWRENAWREAEALAAAPDDAARAIVSQSIENYANSVAQSFLVSFAIPPLGLGQSNATRDAYCAAHQGDTASMPYPMGTPTPYGTGSWG
jgi:hypothetical protein